VTPDAAPGGPPPGRARLFESAGAASVPPGQPWDPRQLRALFSVLVRVRTTSRLTFGRRGRARGLVFSLAMQGVFGLFMSLIVFARTDAFTYSQYLSAVTLFLGAGTLIAEASQLLFSVEENDLLLHRPIHPRTLLLSKSLALFALAAAYALALNFVPTIVGAWARGARPWFGLAHLVSTLLLSVFVAGAVVFLYGLLTRVVGRERFDSLASWFQVVVSAVLIFGYQIVPRLITPASGFRMSPDLPVLWLIPSAWFGMFDALLGGLAPTPARVGMALLAVAVTVLLAAACVSRISSDYARRLAWLGETQARPKVAPGRERRVRPAGKLHPMLRAWMRDPRERAAFQLAATYLRRDREVRMRVYPSLASFLVFPVLALVDRNMGPTFVPLMTAVMAGMLPTMTLESLRTSTQSAAADLFHYVPLESSASLFHGARKAAILWIAAPMLALAFVIMLASTRTWTPVVLTLPALVVLPTLSMLDGLLGEYLPLSRAPESGRQTAIQIGVAMLTLSVMLGLFFVGTAARRLHVFVPMLALELVVVVAGHLALLKVIRERPLRVN